MKEISDKLEKKVGISVRKKGRPPGYYGPQDMEEHKRRILYLKRYPVTMAAKKLGIDGRALWEYADYHNIPKISVIDLYERLIKKGYSREKIIKIVGVTKGTFKNTLGRHTKLKSLYKKYQK